MSYSDVENTTTNYELEYLAKEIFKQSVEIMTWLFLAAYSKMHEERGKLKEEQVNKKKPRLGEIIRLEKIKLGDLLLGKHALEKKKNVKGMAGQPSASASKRSKDQCIHSHSGLLKENRLVIHGSLQPSSAESRNRHIIIQKDLREDPLG